MSSTTPWWTLAQIVASGHTSANVASSLFTALTAADDQPEDDQGLTPVSGGLMVSVRLPVPRSRLAPRGLEPAHEAKQGEGAEERP
jgi:hypothetical protein